MLRRFRMNGYLWRVVIVDEYSPILVSRTGRYSMATTDPNTHYIYLSASIPSNMIARVLLHEISHALMISYNLVNDIHVAVRPEYWYYAEEWLCNYICDYGQTIFSALYQLIGDNAWILLPRYLEEKM